MMGTLAIMVGLLSAIVLAVLYFTARNQPIVGINATQDTINRHYYQQRLQELAIETQQGLIIDQGIVLTELQQSLLADIPNATAATASATQWQQSVSLIKLLGWVMAGSLLITLFVFGLKNNLGTLKNVTQAQERYPQLLLDYHSIGLERSQLPAFMLGLRYQVMQHPKDLQTWLNLGSVGMELNNFTIAQRAFEQAYQLDGNNSTVLANYGRLLLYSRSAEDQQLGRMLLHRALQVDPKNLDVIKIFAFAALDAQDYSAALPYWQMWLVALPEHAQNREIIVKTIEYIKKELQQSSAS